jgi:hypothetical protein
MRSGLRRSPEATLDQQHEQRSPDAFEVRAFFAMGLSRRPNRLGRLCLSILEYWTINYADTKCWHAASCSPLGIYAH